MTEKELPTPCYILDEKKLRSNCEILKRVMDHTGCHILLAQKAFSCFYEYPLIREYLSGTTASSLFEARLGAEEFRKENHIFAPAYLRSEFDEITRICDHIVFNSLSQYEQHRKDLHGVSAGIRINPECPTQEGHEIYDPCRPGSRMGVVRASFDGYDFATSGLEGIHFHTLCEQNSDDLEKTIAAVEEKFADFLHMVKWVNFGGGHHITRADYDIARLERLITHVRDTYDVEVYLEPGEASVLDAGVLVSSVLDIVENDIKIAIIDASAETHMPDVLLMPYRPYIMGSGKPNEKEHTYRIAGPSCLAGDVIGDYSFDEPLKRGDRLVFTDMGLYSIVKNTTFNGINLPDITVIRNTKLQIVKRFGYKDYKCRQS